MSVRSTRIAAAPITWGACEVDGWGRQPSKARVLDEIAKLGVAATELGPPGFLGEDPRDLGVDLRERGLRAVAGFVTAALHDPAEDLGSIKAGAALLAGAGAETLVLAAATGRTGYDRDVELDDQAWEVLLRRLQAAREMCDDQGLNLAVHPHLGTAIERGHHVARLLVGSGTGICLDTGHLYLGGADPVGLARTVPERVLHVHLKDVNAQVARAVRRGTTPYSEAVRQGLYCPLGTGDADIAQVVGLLERAGYQGWYVIEQDRVLTEVGGEEEASLDMARSVAYLESLLA